MRIKSASFNDPLKLSEGVGTSFSSPAIATILQRYSYASPFLVKALILASASLLTGINAYRTQDTRATAYQTFKLPLKQLDGEFAI